ncbi:MAG: cyclic nucleotide-binding domain-containing protein [Pseudomonadota bacterium]|jgi:CRP-like cAMP-binding protein|nr:cyclic nucleotide-binding domain-containing protein [Pseudomonadota bacterium]
MLTHKEFRSCFPELGKHLNKSEIDVLLNSLEECAFEPGEAVTRDGETLDAVYFVVDGELDCYLEAGDERFQIGSINKGQYIGEMAMLDRGPATVTVIATTPVRLLRFTQEKFQAFRETRPELANLLLHAFINMVIERLRLSDEFLLETLMKLEQEHGSFDAGNIRDSFTSIYQQLHGYE